MDSKMELESTLVKDEPVTLTIMECSICYVNKVELSLLCKHSVCLDCYRNIEVCPFCRNIIKRKESIIEDRLIIDDRSEIRNNFYFVICIMMIGPLSLLCFAGAVLITI